MLNQSGTLGTVTQANTQLSVRAQQRQQLVVLVATRTIRSDHTRVQRKQTAPEVLSDTKGGAKGAAAATVCK